MNEKSELKPSMNEFGWSESELEETIILDNIYLDSILNTTEPLIIKAQARWNSRTHQIVVKARDGFVYIINGITEQPPPEDLPFLYDNSVTAWRNWYHGKPSNKKFMH
jgi:hypothetical protein